MLNKILFSMSSLLADPTETTNDALNAVVTYINAILSGIIGVAAAIAVVYAIVVGARMVRANNAEQREEAKKKVIYTVIGIVIAIALIILIQVLTPTIKSLLAPPTTT